MPTGGRAAPVSLPCSGSQVRLLGPGWGALGWGLVLRSPLPVPALCCLCSPPEAVRAEKYIMGQGKEGSMFPPSQSGLWHQESRVLY